MNCTKCGKNIFQFEEGHYLHYIHYLNTGEELCWCNVETVKVPMNTGEKTAFAYTDENIKSNNITFSNMNSDWVMQITADRKIIVNEDVEVTEAAQAVLDALQPLLHQSQTMRELSEDEIKEVYGNYFDVENCDWLQLECIQAILKKARE